MKILIIGGTGNISTAISRALVERGDELFLFKRDPNLPAWLSRATVITGDRSRREEFERKLAAAGPFDCVLDMVAYEPEDAISDVRVFRGRARQFILCSTVDVYSKTPAAYPVSEDSELGALPSFPYAWKKAQCERILRAAHEQGDFALTILRPAFTYNEAWSPGIHSFGGQTYHLDRLLKGKPILLHGDGTSIWVASHRDDVARAFLGAIGNQNAFGRAYNVTGDEWMTHNRIWRTLARLLGAPEPDFVYLPTDLLARLAPKEAEWCLENFRHHNIFDNSRAKRELGFTYTIRFEEGARRCLEFLQRNQLIEDCAQYPFYDRIVEAWRTAADRLSAEIRPNAG
jgi:nucleoside-diphosphate-sugar epimerase